jgi:hypothetical protein
MKQKMSAVLLSRIAHSYLLQSTQEELAVLRTELEVLKSGPQTYGEKGNSVFAEVEDKRLNMKRKLQAVLQKYHNLKKLYMDKCAEDTRFSVSTPSCLSLL